MSDGQRDLETLIREGFAQREVMLVEIPEWDGEFPIFEAHSFSFSWPEMEENHIVDEPRDCTSFVAVKGDDIYVQQEGEDKHEFYRRVANEDAAG